MGRHEWFARMGRAMVPLDRALSKLTKGRFVAVGLRDLPSLMITTTERKSGQPRANPLLYAPDGDAFVVIGSNWGQTSHPAWSSNLLADPQATVTLGGKVVHVNARLVRDDERVRLRAKLLEVWPGYADYERRAGGRHLRIFRLERRG
jgi:deazaflavin-dependent oxidoreductase (nitroreductase family)